MDERPSPDISHGHHEQQRQDDDEDELPLQLIGHLESFAARLFDDHSPIQCI